MLCQSEGTAPDLIPFLQGEHEPTGEFAKASAETLKKRKIVKARRPGSAMATEPTPSAVPAVPAATSNPFTGMALKPSAASSNPFSGVNLAKPAQVGHNRARPGKALMPEPQQPCWSHLDQTGKSSCLCMDGMPTLAQQPHLR